MVDENNTAGPTRGEFSQDLKIEGVFLHVRAIIEQGRTDEFIDACKEAGYLALKGQEGLIAFTRDFVLAGPKEGRAIARRTPFAENLYEAIQQKDPDIC